MANPFDTSEGAGVFRCPACKEFISVSSSECRFCGASVSDEEAKELARAQGALDNAIAGARTIRLMIGPLLVLFLLTPLIGIIYPTAVLVITAVMAVRWLCRFRSIPAPQLQSRRRQVWVIASLTVMAGLFFLVIVLQELSLRI